MRTVEGSDLHRPLYPHELRHTSARKAIASGTHVKGMQEMLGHKGATMTQDLCGPLFPDRLDAVADATDAARTRASGAAADDRLLAQTGASVVVWICYATRTRYSMATHMIRLTRGFTRS